MKSEKYYQGLDTSSVAKECFTRTIFFHEMVIYDNPEYGLIRLKVMHNGFAELFGREDLWKGILDVYYALGYKLDPSGDSTETRHAARNLGVLGALYRLPEFRQQAEGKEQLFLRANLHVLRRFRLLLDHGVNAPFPYIIEVKQTARVALDLLKRWNPQRYQEIQSEVTAERWRKLGDASGVKKYLDMIFRLLGESEGQIGGESPGGRE
jgi:hypothetical protein